MTNMTRRAFGLTGLALPVAIGATTTQTLAAGHAAQDSGSAYSASLGTYRITALLDGIAPLQREFFFGEDAAAINTVLAEAGFTNNQMPAPINAYLLQSDDRTILIDAGMGEVDILGPGLGKMGAALATAGVSPGDIDTVIVTHAHPDHIGGLIASGGAAFANAELVIPEIEVGFWGDAGTMAQAPAEAQGMFGLAQQVFGLYSDRLRPVSGGTEVAPGITLDLSPGHTPGHSVLTIDGGDRTLLMVADTLHSAELHTALPETGFGFDTDPGEAAASRARIFDRAATDNMLIAGSHIHFPGFGRFVRDGDAYRYIPASWL